MKGITQEQVEAALFEVLSELHHIGTLVVKASSPAFFKKQREQRMNKAPTAFNEFNASLTPQRLHVLGVVIFTHIETNSKEHTPEICAALDFYCNTKPELVQQINKRVREGMNALPADKQDHFYNAIEELKNANTK